MSDCISSKFSEAVDKAAYTLEKQLEMRKRREKRIAVAFISAPIVMRPGHFTHNYTHNQFINLLIFLDSSNGGHYITVTRLRWNTINKYYEPKMCLGVDFFFFLTFKRQNTPFEERLLKIFYLKTVLHTKVACKNQNKIRDVCLSVSQFNITLFCANKNILKLWQSINMAQDAFLFPLLNNLGTCDSDYLNPRPLKSGLSDPMTKVSSMHLGCGPTCS